MVDFELGFVSALGLVLVCWLFWPQITFAAANTFATAKKKVGL